MPSLQRWVHCWIGLAAGSTVEAARRGKSTMAPEELQGLFADLRVWHARGWRAPNKPLLALWAIGRCLRNEPRLAPYDEIARELGGLLAVLVRRESA